MGTQTNDQPTARVSGNAAVVLRQARTANRMLDQVLVQEGIGSPYERESAPPARDSGAEQRPHVDSLF